MDNEILTETTPYPENEMTLSLNNMEIDTIGEILNISMGSAATAVSTLLGRKVSITTPTVSVVKSTELSLENLEPAIGIEIEYIEGLSGKNLLVMRSKDIKAIVNLLLSDIEETDDEELDEIHISAVSEIMNQMMGASSTALSSFLGKSINISTPKQFNTATKLAEIGSGNNPPNIVTVRFMLEVEGLINSEFVTIMTTEFTKELVKKALNFDDLEEVVKTPEKPEIAPVLPLPTTGSAEKPLPDKTTPESGSDSFNSSAKAPPVSVKPLKLQVFEDDKFFDEEPETSNDNFNLILGVPLDVTVEIGRTKMPVKNILDIRPGSIVELDRQAGDPVDVIVNGQLIAKGDVVVIDDNFGVRIVEILSKKEISRNVN